MLQADGLTKRFGPVVALDALTLRVGPGEVCCLLGGNGAGKTTTLNLFLGFLAPDAGRYSVAGVDVAADPVAAKRRLAYVPEQVALYPNLSGLQKLAYFAELAHGGPVALDRGWAGWRWRTSTAAFWTGTAALVNVARAGSSSAANALALALGWLGLVGVEPALLDAAVERLRPLPTSVERVGRQRGVELATPRGETLVDAFFAEHPDWRPPPGTPPESADDKWLTPYLVQTSRVAATMVPFDSVILTGSRTIHAEV